MQPGKSLKIDTPDYLKLVLILVFVAIFSAFNWLDGYWVDPAFLGLFTPFIALFILFLPIAILIWMMIGLMQSHNKSFRSYWSLLIACMAVVFLFSPMRPTAVDGFYYRMGKIDYDEYMAAVELINSEAARLNLSDRDFTYPVTEAHNKLVRSLADKNILFSLSDWPVHIAKKDKYILLSWASGLTGGYEVLITFGEEEPPWLENRLYPPKKLYKNVFLLID